MGFPSSMFSKSNTERFQKRIEKAKRENNLKDFYNVLLDWSNLESEEKLSEILDHHLEWSVMTLENTLMRESDPDVKTKSILFLGAIGNQMAIDALSRCMRSERAFIRRESTRIWLSKSISPLQRKAKKQLSISKISPPVDQFQTALKDIDYVCRSLAAELIGEMGIKSAIKDLIEILTDDLYMMCRRSAARALKELQWQPSNNKETAALLVALDRWEELDENDSAIVAPLLLALISYKREDRANSYNILKRIGWKPENNIDRAYLSISMREWDEVEKIGVEAARPLLVVADCTSIYSREAMGNLVNIIDRSATYAIPILTEMLYDWPIDEYMVSGAIQCLDKMGIKTQ